MMQDVEMPKELRPRELVALASSYYSNPFEVVETLQRAGITQFADRPYGKLSGGQKRQTQFAVAICGHPKVLFLDEPTVGLDVQAREALWKCIRALLADGCSIVLTTHYLEEAEALADRVAVMARGRLITTGSVNEIRSHVSRKQVSCVSRLAPDTVRAWPEAAQVEMERDRLQINTREAEALLVRLFREDPQLSDIEVKRAGLAEAFTELTNESKGAA